MMNERIKKLAEQCTTQYRDGHGGHIDQVDTEKFAELIVRECEVILSKESERLYGLSSHGSDDYDICADKCRENIKAIKEHFGVEE
jgi:predicted site-specific integrase-resolvase